MSNHTQADGVPGYPKVAHGAKSASKSSTVKLPADLGIEQAAELHKTLLKRVGDSKRVTFDAADIQRIHTAALQLFCLFCRDRRSAGRETQWRKPSAALRSAAALLGATTLLSMGQDG